MEGETIRSRSKFQHFNGIGNGSQKSLHRNKDAEQGVKLVPAGDRSERYVGTKLAPTEFIKGWEEIFFAGV